MSSVSGLDSLVPSHYKHVHPMRQIAETQKLSAATSTIYGIALGYLPIIISVVNLGITILVAHYLCGIFGVALGALGIGYAWHTDNGTDHRCLRPHLGQRGRHRCDVVT